MPLPEMPWYEGANKALQPVDRYMQWLLLGVAIVCIWIAVKGTPATRTAFFVYLVSP